MLGAAGGTSLQMSSAAQSALSDRSPINIAPIGFNLGAILQPMNEGSPENGGAGMDFMRRYTGAGVGTSASDITSSNLLPFILMGGGGLVLLLVVLKKRR